MKRKWYSWKFVWQLILEMIFITAGSVSCFYIFWFFITGTMTEPIWTIKIIEMTTAIISAIYLLALTFKKAELIGHHRIISKEVNANG